MATYYRTLNRSQPLSMLPMTLFVPCVIAIFIMNPFVKSSPSRLLPRASSNSNPLHNPLSLQLPIMQIHSGLFINIDATTICDSHSLQRPNATLSLWHEYNSRSSLQIPKLLHSALYASNPFHTYWIQSRVPGFEGLGNDENGNALLQLWFDLRNSLLHRNML